MEAQGIKEFVAVSTPIFLFFIGLGIGVIGYFLKSFHKDIRDRFEKNEAKMESLDRAHMEYKAELPHKYVLKDDYIRTLSVFEKKLDDIVKELKNIAGRKDGEQ